MSEFFRSVIAKLRILTSYAHAAATLHASGVTQVETSSQAAEALRPLAGPLAFWLFALGIVGTGLLGVPVLAGSAAYAVAEARRWRSGLWRRPKDAPFFYGTLTFATLIGVILNFSPINPIRALYWSAVINGVVAVPVMIVLMHMTANPKVMGKFRVSDGLRVIGWISTSVMFFAALAMVVTSGGLS
jgi:Mn2+/Fe2+ NRAMP family transporter